MAGLINKAKDKTTQTTQKTLEKAADAKHDPADLSSKPGAKLLDIPLDQLTYNPLNPRDEDIEADPETLELAESMKLLGQLQSAVVVAREVYLQRWPDEADQIPTPWVLMMGNRRKAAAGLNGWRTVECIIRERITKDLEQLADLPIHENLHRKGINPLKMAYYLADQVKLLGGERPVAKKVGKSQPWVNQLLKLLKLIPELQALIQSNEITATTGRALAKLDHEEQRRIWGIVSELEGEHREEFWSAGAWGDKSFITPATPEVVYGEPGEEEPDQEPPAGTAKTSRPAPAIVIRIMERSPAALAAELRDKLSDDEVEQLVRELTHPQQ